MAWVPGGRFLMGSDRHYPEEAPAHHVDVDGFFMDVTPVTNKQFGRFVVATGYVTFAEKAPTAEDYPGALPEMLFAGSLVFSKPRHRIADMGEWSQWWSFRKGANWREPFGPGGGHALHDHPVVHVVYADALAYAEWAGKSLPTEAEFEFAARGGLDGAEFAWGDELVPNGKYLANFWQGEFPSENSRKDGFERTSPVGAFPPNPYGLHDLIGNVWEWTSDWYSKEHEAEAAKACCVPRNPRGASEEASLDPCFPDAHFPRKVLKGGSHLCAPNYCRRYRPAARYPQPIDTSTCHIGFRCVVRPRSL
jgi:formylglycine-generating enzyme required for sulfatase activity